jgi:putative ABC transport system substrate-binding protein
MDRRTFIGCAAGGFLAVPLAAEAQQPTPKLARIGFLGVGSASVSASRVEGLRQGLRDRGYVEGRTISIDFRWADGNYAALPGLADELVRLPVDVLVAQGAPGSRAAKQATATIPIVMTAAGDAVVTGLVGDLARPGGNLTGLTFFSPELSAKRIELLKSAIPRIVEMAVLMNPDNPVTAPGMQRVESTAKALNVELKRFAVRGPKELDGAFTEMVRQRVGGVAIVEDAMLNVHPGAIAVLARAHRLASAGNKEFAEAGGLIGYGVNFYEIFRRAAYFVDKLLKGERPGELPVEQSARFDLLVNLSTAKALGITIPQSLLVRADEVIQ